jgi:hypothetical protein
MEGSLMYMPCFDPEIDTFESLRNRSPFCITTLVMVDHFDPRDRTEQCRHANLLRMLSAESLEIRDRSGGVEHLGAHHD